ncbi:MAG: glycosyltransferase family 1 protein [Chloroflexaceae bacterium]|nr:glycosyltransferase family 1 protein [Chloroflexaceae bacterium]
MTMIRRSPTILMAGPWVWPWYHEACACALETLGCQVERFSLFDVFYRRVPGRVQPAYRSWWVAWQNRFLIGPTMHLINRRFRIRAHHRNPDIVWLYNCQHLFSRTIAHLHEQQPQTQLVHYINDNPFSPHARKEQWRHVYPAIRWFHLNLVFRHSNIADFARAGSRATQVLRAYYVPELHYRQLPERHERHFHNDVVFVGHYENDGRLGQLEAIARAGHQVALFGGGWPAAERVLAADSPLRRAWPVEPVVGADYRKALSGSKIALCFLSHMNADTYTTRTFEIPAMQTFILSEYSDDLATLFREGVEAEYFRTREELLAKIAFYLRHDRARETIARRGYERLRKDGHDVTSRMREWLHYVSC